MKLAVSNLAFKTDEALAVCRENGITGIEVCPTRLTPSWKDFLMLRGEMIDVYAEKLDKHGLEISSFASIFNGIECSLTSTVSDFIPMLEHLSALGAVARRHTQSAVMVYGSPLTRAHHVPDDVLRARLSMINQVMLERNSIFAVEPVTEEMGARVLNSVEKIGQVASGNIRLHFDTNCVEQSLGDPLKTLESRVSQIAHFHASEKDLAPIGDQGLHEDFGKTLRRYGYKGWIVMEALNLEPEEFKSSVEDFAKAYA